MHQRLIDATREVGAFMGSMEPEPKHVLQVAQNSLQLFDCLRELHHRTPPDRALLEWAALLHDIGWSIRADGRGHHKASAELIRSHDWKHLFPNEIKLVALIARYHRKTPPTTRHAEFAALRPADQKRVRQLAALLRIGDALDRSHRGVVRRIGCLELSPKAVLLELEANEELGVERLGFQKKSDLFTDVFHRTVDFTVVPSRFPESP